jgi:hypothetical protein
MLQPADPVYAIVQAVALPEVQSVGEYEARYGAYNTQRHQQRPPEQGEEEASRDSPIIFRHLHKKKSESRLPESAIQVRASMVKCLYFIRSISSLICLHQKFITFSTKTK